MRDLLALLLFVLTVMLWSIVTDGQLSKLDEFVCQNVKCLEAR